MTTKAQKNCMRIVDELIGFGAVKGSEINQALLEKAIRKCVGIDDRTVSAYVKCMQDFDFLKISANGWTLEKLVLMETHDIKKINEEINADVKAERDAEARVPVEIHDND